LPHSVLGASYGRKKVLKGGVAIFVCKNYNFLNVDLSNYCKEQEIDACAIRLQLNALNIYIITVYRAPCGNFDLFLKTLDSIIESLYKADLKLIICGDINIDYLTDNARKKQLDSMLLSYNLAATVHSPLEYKNNPVGLLITYSLISKNSPSLLFPPYMCNGLSDHDAQLLTLKDINIQTTSSNIHYIRITNKWSIEEFKLRLSFESWDSVFGNTDNINADSLFNTFLNNYLRLVNTSFPLQKIIESGNSNEWITRGIKTSCNHKRQLYLLCRDSGDIKLIKHYKHYC
jgi:hypothetical protein